jgi:ABC-2 type transport system permease protein
MNPTSNAVRAGLARGWIELRQTFTYPQDVWNYLFLPAILLVVVYFMGGATVPGTDFSLGAMALPGVLGMYLAWGGLVGLAMTLIIEREDGTLLRAKAIPGGMVGYLVGKIVQTAGIALISVTVFLGPGVFLFDGLTIGDPGSWLTLAWVLLLGLLATLPLGAILGSLFSNPRNLWAVILPMWVMISISGIFYPITRLPEWLQWVAQLFPVYWLGLGVRSALLPDELAAVEIGGSWRHLETVGVLGLWALVGLLVAPAVLRRMARRESGADLEARRQKAMQRIG